MGEMGNPAVVFGVYAAVVYDIISATNSSPQTTEVNAAARAETLMKWVKLGLAQAAFFVILGAVAAKATGYPWWPPALGGALAGLLLWLQYVHARNSGLKSGLPGTENYENPGSAQAY